MLGNIMNAGHLRLHFNFVTLILQFLDLVGAFE